MPVYRIEAEMPHAELREWIAHFALSADEAKLEAEKRAQRGRR